MKYLILLASLWIASGLSSAQTVISGLKMINEGYSSPHLSLQHAIDQALIANPGYLNLQDQAIIADMKLENARSVYKTKFASSTSSDARSGADVGSTYNLYLNKRNESGSSYSAGIYNSSFGDKNLSEMRFSYTLPFFKNPLDGNRLAVDQSEIDVVKRRRMIEIGREELVHQVVSGYYRLALATIGSDLAEKKYTIAEKIHNAREIKARHGEISELELARSRFMLAEAQQQRNMVQFDREQQEGNFKILIGFDVEEPISIDTEIYNRADDQLFSVPLEQLEQQAMGLRTELLAKQEEILMMQRRVQAARTGSIPPIEISLQYALVGEGDGLDESFKLDEERFGIGFRMDTDFGNSVRKNKQYRLQLQLKSEQRDLVYLKNRIKLEVRKAHFELLRSQRQLELASQGLDLADGVYRQSSILHEKGQLTHLELLESEHRVEDARYQSLSARINFLIAGQHLAKASGRYRQQWKY